MFSYPSSAELAAMKKAAQSGSFSIADALAMPLSPEAHDGMLALNKRIPAHIQGIFRIELNEGALQALQIVPDATSEALNRLRAAIGQSHRYFEHGALPTIRYQGAELQALIDTPSRLKPDEEINSVNADIIRKGYEPERTYTNDGQHYVGSYRLCDAIHLRTLPTDEKQFLSRVLRVVGDDLGGAFAINLIARDGKPVIDSLFIAPNVVGHQLMDEVLTPVDRSLGKVRNFHSVGMREHWGDYTLEQRQLDALRALGDTLSTSLRGRA